MRHSYATKTAALQDGLAVGYRHWFGFPFPVPKWPVPGGSLPSGQLISTAEDLAHYLIAHLNGGQYKDKQILSNAGIDEMHRGVKELKLGDFGGGLYGMGWFEIDMGDEKTYSHGGNVPDFSAYMALIPGQRKAFVLLLNADPYGLPMITAEIGNGVTTLLAGQAPGPIQLEFVQWIIRLLPLIPLLQLKGVMATLGKLRKWEQEPELRPTDGGAWAQEILLPLVPNLGLAAFLAYLHRSRLIQFLNLFMPDLALILNISGGLAGIWSVLRTRLMLHAEHKTRH